MNVTAQIRLIERNLEIGGDTIAAKECTGLIESALRQVFCEQLTRLTETDRLKVQEAERTIGKGEKGAESFTMGQLVGLLRTAKFLEAWERVSGKDLSSVRMINLDQVTALRNEFIHGGREATRAEAKLLFDALRMILETFELVPNPALNNPAVFLPSEGAPQQPPAVPPSPVKKILILSANPKNTNRLRLDEEVREIEEGLQRSKQREQFRIHARWAVRLRDLRRAMLDDPPQIVHFCGHGEGEDGIIFEDDAGAAKFVNAHALSEFFKLCAESVECVVLNACYSEIQAAAIAQHIPYVIGMKRGLHERAALEFAVAFYDALAAGKSVEFAFNLGRNAIQLVGLPEHLSPVLLPRKGITPNPPSPLSQKIHRKHFSSYRSFLLVITLGLSIFLLFRNTDLRFLELKILDWKFKPKSFYRPEKNPKIVIMGLNDDFLLEDHTIAREKLALLIRSLAARNAKVIGLDLLLDTPQKGDAALIEAIKTAGNVIIPFDIQAISGKRPEIILPLPEFEKAAVKIGFANFSFIPIYDGIVRDLPLEWKGENAIYYYPFALEVLRYVYPGKGIAEILIGNPEKTKALKINFDSQDRFPLNIVKLKDLEGGLNDSAYKDKIVLIGYVGKHQPADEFSTPLDPKMKGIFIHAQILNTITSGQYLRTWDWLNFLIVLLCALFGVSVLTKLGWLPKVIILSVIGASYFFMIRQFFIFMSLDLPLWSPLLTLILAAFLKSKQSYEMAWKAK